MKKFLILGASTLLIAASGAGGIANAQPTDSAPTGTTPTDTSRTDTSRTDQTDTSSTGTSPTTSPTGTSSRSPDDTSPGTTISRGASRAGGDAANPRAAAPASPASEAHSRVAPKDASTYVAKAGASDMWEIESSRALLAKSGNADLKRFAQMMIDQHSQSTAKIKTAATTARIQVTPPKLDADQQKMLDDIKRADAAGVDAVYIRHQRAAHEKALALHRTYAASGDNNALKRTANEIVPVVEMHRTHLDRLGTPSQR